MPTIKDLALKDLKIAKKMGWLDREGYPYVDLVLYFSAEFGDDLMELERLYE